MLIMDNVAVASSPHITPRQLECMALVRQGLTSKQIARELGISHRTVEIHVAAVLDALQVNNRMAAVMRLDELKQVKEQKPDSEASGQAFLLNGFDADFELSLVTGVATEPAAAPSSNKPRLSFLPLLGGRTICAPASIRKAWMVRIAALSIIASCLIIVFISGASEIANALQQ